MWDIIQKNFDTDIDPGYQQEFDRQLDIDNLLKTKIVALLGTGFFLPLLFLDYYRYTIGSFGSDFMTPITFVLHLMMMLFLIPVFIIKKNETLIEQRKYEHSRRVVNGTLLNLGITLLGMTINTLILKDNVFNFSLYIIILNLVFLLPPKIRLGLNLASLIIIMLAVFLIQANDTHNFIINLLEVIGITTLTFLISAFQYNQRVDQFKSEKLLEKQSMVVEEALVADFNKKVSEIEMRALRAQMNPHFLFNVLNSIKLYMVQNNSQQAAAYLTKFSRLIRLILNNSKSKLVLLSQEIDALKLYIELEQLRFNNKFDFKIDVAVNMDIDFLEIPPMILQPFIENAIWHGLMHKVDGKGMLIINIQEKAGHIKILIEDNGIGRAKSQSINRRSPTKHKSFGMKITTERIDIVNHIYDTNASVEIIDLKDEKDNGNGTRVIINLPIHDNKS